MPLIAALGNPGKEYENTRHNVGWLVLDAFAQTLEGSWKTDKKLQASIFSDQGPIAIGPRGGASLVLLKPLTFMNNSGLAVAAFLKQRKFSTRVEQYGLDPLRRSFSEASKLTTYSSSEVKRSREVPFLVLHDDIDLPLGTVRVSFGASAGGHNGVQSIIDHIGTKEFWRIRIGVAPAQARPNWKQKTDPKIFVLKKFSAAQKLVLEGVMLDILELVKETIEGPRVHTIKAKPPSTEA